MRKDLRYGMGIGALLMAFIVTFLVVRNHTEKQAAQAGANPTDAADDGGETGGAEANPTGVIAAGDTPMPNAAAALPPLKPMPVNGGTTVRPPTPSDDPFAERRPAKPANDRRAPAAKPAPADGWDRLLAEGWPSAQSQPPAAPRPQTVRPQTAVAPPGRAGTSVPPPAFPTTPRRTGGVAGVTNTASTGGRDGGESAALLRPVTTIGSIPGEGPTAADATSAGGTPVAVRTGRPYTVREGDTFVSIAKAAFGNGKYFLQIEKANPAVNPARLKIGQQIVLPELTVEARAAKDGPFDNDADNRPVNPRTEYRVDTGDSLYRIAQKVYGTHRMSEAIYDANRAAIGADPTKLRFGMILRLPQSVASN